MVGTCVTRFGAPSFSMPNTAHSRPVQQDLGDAPSTRPGASGFDAEDLIPIYVSMRHELERFLLARLGDAAAAQDVYQGIFLRLKSATLKDRVGNPRALLYKIAANAAADYRRGQRRGQVRDHQWLDSTTYKVGPDAVADTASADDAIDAKRRLGKVLQALNDLSPKCRRTFIMHKLEGLSHLEVAARLGVSRKAVEKHMATALKHLVKVLRSGGPDQ